MSDYDHCLHEARHIVGAFFARQEVQGAAVGFHAPVDAEGIVYTAPSENGIAELLGRLLGWLGDEDLPPRVIWPPRFPPPTGRGRDPDGVGWCVKHFGISERGYEQTCELAEELAESPDFQQAVDLVASALAVAPRLDRESLEILREAAGFAEPETERTPA